jgi:Fe-S-cluster containining protein
MSQDNPWYAPGLRFECTQCGQCCSGPPGYVWMTEEEITAIAAHLQLDRETFLANYAEKYGDQWSIRDYETPHGHDCLFLKRTPDGRGGCSIYSVRPTQCRTWPFWPENVVYRSSWKQVAQRCPGVAQCLGQQDPRKGDGKFYSVDQIRIVRLTHPKMPE